MDFQTILVYCLCADLLIALHHTEDSQCQMSDTEMMTTALVAALYFGVKIHLLVTKDHQPRPVGTRFFLRWPSRHGGLNDTDALTQFDFDLLPRSQIFADKAYTYYLVEDLLAEVDIQLAPNRKKNSKRPCPIDCTSSSASTVTKWKRREICTQWVPGGFCPRPFML